MSSADCQKLSTWLSNSSLFIDQHWGFPQIDLQLSWIYRGKTPNLHGLMVNSISFVLLLVGKHLLYIGQAIGEAPAAACVYE